jgi:alanine racemase
MVDVSDIEAHDGDEVIVFGKSPSVMDIAGALHTIPYEVLTGISRRVKRVYYKE